MLQAALDGLRTRPGGKCGQADVSLIAHLVDGSSEKQRRAEGDEAVEASERAI
jgi:hypothetical protein